MATCGHGRGGDFTFKLYHWGRVTRMELTEFRRHQPSGGARREVLIGGNNIVPLAAKGELLGFNRNSPAAFT